MITEDYVSFETAKLLREKGFNGLCTAYYDCFTTDNFHCGSEPTDFNSIDIKIRDIVAAPTLQMTMKWLREVQALNIYARGVWKDVEISVFGDWEPAVVGYEWIVESLTDDTYSKMGKEQFLTYEEACEAAVKYCLENLV